MTRTKFIPATLAALLLIGTAAPSHAQQTASHNPAEAQSGTFTADSGHTQIGWTVSHMGFSNFTGRLSGVTGSLTLSAANPASSKLSVSVPTASFNTPVERLNAELVGDKWFDAEKFPTITFVSTKITPTGKDSATVAGDLTMHGVTKPVTLTAHFVGAGTNPLSKKYNIGFEATGTVKRSEFGVATYVPLIADEVQLSLNGAFERQE